MLTPLYKTQKQYHHKPFQKHTHAQSAAAGNSGKAGTREIKVLRKVLDVNDAIAAQNRRMFAQNRVLVFNVMSSPGSGKTTTLERRSGISCRKSNAP